MPAFHGYPDRVLRTRKEAQQTYNRLSRWYDWLARSELSFKTMAVQMLDAQPGEAILEIGFGTGQSLSALATQVAPDGQIFGIDLSMGMAVVAHRRLTKAGQSPQIQLHLGDAAALPYTPNRFNAILMVFTLELFDTPEISSVLGECRRVLCEGGRLCIASLVLPDSPNLVTRAYDWFHRSIPTWVDCRPIPLRTYLSESAFWLEKVWTGSLWGLPVEIVCAQSQPPPEQDYKIDHPNRDKDSQNKTE